MTDKKVTNKQSTPQTRYTVRGLVIAVAAIAFIFMAFTSQQEKNLKVELPVAAWQEVLDVIEQSNAPHQQVKAVQKALLSQLQEQLQADTTNQNQ